MQGVHLLGNTARGLARGDQELRRRGVIQEGLQQLAHPLPVVQHGLVQVIQDEEAFRLGQGADKVGFLAHPFQTHAGGLGDSGADVDRLFVGAQGHKDHAAGKEAALGEPAAGLFSQLALANAPGPSHGHQAVGITGVLAQDQADEVVQLPFPAGEGVGAHPDALRQWGEDNL